MERNRPLSVAVSIVTDKNKILLIKRNKEPYKNKLGLPGGKVELGEHISESAIRETLEESGIKSSFKKHLGIVSEHLLENGSVKEHFLLHVCELAPKNSNIIQSAEGEVRWFNIKNLDVIKNEIIPSDFLIIEKIVRNKEKNYFECVMEKLGEDYILKKFE